MFKSRASNLKDNMSTATIRKNKEEKENIKNRMINIEGSLIDVQNDLNNCKSNSEKAELLKQEIILELFKEKEKMKNDYQKEVNSIQNLIEVKMKVQKQNIESLINQINQHKEDKINLLRYIEELKERIRNLEVLVGTNK